jgi:hypothetical protein
MNSVSVPSVVVVLCTLIGTIQFWMWLIVMTVVKKYLVMSIEKSWRVGIEDE